MADKLEAHLEQLRKNHFEDKFCEGFQRGYGMKSKDLIAATSSNLQTAYVNGMMFGAIAAALERLEGD